MTVFERARVTTGRPDRTARQHRRRSGIPAPQTATAPSPDSLALDLLAPDLRSADTLPPGLLAPDLLAPALYDAALGHIRTVPTRNEFTHRVYYWLVDLDQLPRLPFWQRPLARFESRDHLGDPNRSIKDNVLAFLTDNGVDLAGGRVLMLANARSFGYVFNPITVHWCYSKTGELVCILAEVHNTYGERHAYLLRPDTKGRVQQDKEFYVSPFLSVDGHYLMRFSPPAQTVSITIALRQDNTTVFTATLKGERRPATTRSLLRAVTRRPAMAMMTSLWIRIRGVRLWAGRLPMVKRTPHTPQKDVQ